LDKPASANGPDTVEPFETQLEDTGERFLPGVEGKAEISYDHIARYRFTERFLASKEVVDLGCGAGYGSHALSKVARRVTAIDLSQEAIAHAATQYQAPNLSYEVGDVTGVPYEDGTFDAAVSFEVIEHLDDPEDLVVEARRVIKEDGVFIVSTPDKQTYSNERNSVNLYHPSEMYAPEFEELLKRHFSNVRLHRQGAISGSLITRNTEELAPEGRVEMESAQFSMPDPGFGSELPTTLYIIAVCSDGPIDEENSRLPYFILDRDRQIYDEYEELYLNLRRMFSAARYHRMNFRQRGNAERKLRAVERKLRAMENSRAWKVSRRLIALKSRVLALRRRALRLLRRR
jgi:SAM-dependent methyltransferase